MSQEEPHVPETPETSGTPEMSKKLKTIGQLSEMINLVDFSAYIGRRTKYGDKPHSEPWGYTRKYLATYPVPISLPNLIALFEGVGCHNEVQAAEWIVLNDKHIPD